MERTEGKRKENFNKFQLQGKNAYVAVRKAITSNVWKQQTKWVYIKTPFGLSLLDPHAHVPVLL